MEWCHLANDTPKKYHLMFTNEAPLDMTVRDVELSIVGYEHYIDTFQHYYKDTCPVLTSGLLLLVVHNFIAIFLTFCRKAYWPRWSC